MEGVFEEPEGEREDESETNQKFHMDVEHCIYTWHIPNTTGEIRDALWFTSPSFSFGSDEFSTWDIKFFPLAIVDEARAMRFLLRRTGSGEEPEILFVTFRFGFTNSSGNKVWLKEHKRVVFRKLESQGNHTSLFGHMKDFLRDCDNDTMTVICELYVGLVSVPKESDDVFIDGNEFDDLRLLSEDMTRLYTRRSHPGVLLRVADKSYQVHNSILSARSKTFSEFLRDGSRYLEYPDIDQSIMDTLMYFLYSGNLSQSYSKNHLAIGLYECAKTLDICGLDKFLIPTRILARTVTYEEKCWFLWTVESFMARDLSIGRCVRSPKFSTSIDTGCAWFMGVYPRGVVPEPEKVIIVVQPCMQSYEAVFMTVTVTILDYKGRHLYLMCQKKFVCSGITFVFPVFPTSVLESFKNELLPDDALTIHCKVRVLNAKHLLRNLFEARTPYRDRANFERMSGDFQTLYEKEDLKDFQFQIRGGTLEAHMGVLFARSRIVPSLWLIERRKLDIPDFEFDIFQKMLFYLYTGKFKKLNCYEAMDLLKMARKYQIPSLRAKCCHFLSSHLSVDKVFDVIQSIHQNNIDEIELKTACFEYIRNNAEESFEHRDWTLLQHWDPDLAREIADFCLGVSFSETVYQRCSRYVNEVLLFSVIMATFFWMSREP